MLTSSAKQKGRILQQHVGKCILTTFSSLTDRDVVSTSMGKSGVDIQLSEAAIKLFPYAVECKNQEAVSIWSCWKQAELTATKEKLIPLLVIKRNRSIPLAIVKLDDFLKLFER